MAHFAEIDATNTVVRVLVVPDDQEHRGQEFLADDLEFGGTWIQTSYNTRGNVHVGEDGEPDGGTALRMNYAGIGYSWDGTGFAPPQPYPSWTLNETTFQWEPPTPNTTAGYDWDEDTLSWVKPDSPFPSWVWTEDRWQPPTPYPDDGPFYDWDEATTSWVEVTE
jgi:hypothetical protein